MRRFPRNTSISHQNTNYSKLRYCFNFIQPYGYKFIERENLTMLEFCVHYYAADFVLHE